MTAFNIVRMKVKSGHEDAYLALQGQRDLSGFEGLRSFNLVSTGDREYVVLGEWESMEALAAARPAMIQTLDEMREHLEDLGADLGMTDPRSGEAVVSHRAS